MTPHPIKDKPMNKTNYVSIDDERFEVVGHTLEKQGKYLICTLKYKKPLTTPHPIDPIDEELNYILGLRGTPKGTVVTISIDSLIEAKQAIKSLVTKARISELKQLEPPEQYENYAKLMGSDACTICGFNAIKFRQFIAERIAELTQQTKESEQ